ncbi:hypothetical protein CDL12_21441 [Handroanthus impetiginosus]|uniref:RING-type E3 ubiquitin transferase n=1 Tax=Handroanthus impetiginosus TaxID=429701 RepID=A0A2G9GL83_9LAMI|nr:hypothetical protein CDL12_21441 [Handroanthus impetiginosus]
MMSSGTNLVMTVIGFSMSIMFIVFVCTRLIWARIHLSLSRRSLPNASRSDLNILERGPHGLEPLTLANFPTKKYRELCMSSKENSRCTVCLTDYHEEDTLRILPICGHSFHASCIDIWLQQHSTCPVCRVSLRERKWFMQPMFSSAVRSQYTIRSVNAHYCCCIVNENRGPSRPHDNSQRQEACRQSEGDGNSISIDHQQIIKDSASRKVQGSLNE